ncbi:hypothetical protein J2125_000913 [Erwinia toletana]|uniref:Bacteriophage protein n=1 Tax=Winslowiella toletana TaxID=92490 RepID=A0ABS4P4Z9_9GAMM|nr:hypothetical protein [Winslowiella toletana]MBP2167721.1 hypothetical protein [Winslowiella toletana]
MSQNWMRHFELWLQSNNGNQVRLDDFKVTFKVDWVKSSWPRVATVKIYNLADDTANSILGNQFDKIKIIAGYNGLPSDDNNRESGANFGEIFNGDIRFTITGRDNPTDTYILIQAIDGLNAFNYAHVNSSIAAGYKLADVGQLTMRSFNPFGVTAGIFSSMPETIFPRGRALYGMSRDAMNNIAAQCHASWQFVDGQVQLVSTDKYIYEAIILNRGSGLIGMPKQTMTGGVNAECLINPNIRVNGLVEIRQESVYRTALDDSDIRKQGPRLRETQSNGNSTVSGAEQQPRAVAADGVYIVDAITYNGDTRGNDWKMSLVCRARGVAEAQTSSANQPAAS